MSEIDIQNAKQIRQPMDVLITMTLADDDISMTYSGYSSAKVADGVLNQRNWSMRKLADLQGDGFPLDGTHVLYNSATQPSQANGKLGVRSNVGESVSVTATGSKMIASLTIIVTGAESVTYGGTTTPITGSSVTIPVLSTSITMTFNPANETERIEISDIYPDTAFRITNDNLIKATVSLRSDLSLFDQTLPESEINIEVYHDEDVSEDVANIPADTPIIYQAGYEGDMSPERKFYVAGQVTWADNVLTIHAVDAVHFLDDVYIVAPLSSNNSRHIANVVRYVLDKAGIQPDTSADRSWSTTLSRWIIPENTNARTFIAFLNQTFNITDSDGDLLDGDGSLYNELQFSYIDAGRPTVRTWNRYMLDREINENDCADIKKNVEPDVGSVITNWKKLLQDDMSVSEGAIAKVGSATLLKDIGTSLTFDEYSFYWEIGLFAGRNYDNEIATKMLDKYGTLWGWGYMQAVVPGNKSGSYIGSASYIGQPITVGYALAKGEIPQSEFAGNDYSSFVPWNQSYSGWRYDSDSSHKITTASQMWNVLKDAGIMDSAAESLDLDIYGFAFYFDPQALTFTKRQDGAVYDYGDAPIMGQFAIQASGGRLLEIYPEKMLSAPMYRSNITGSFTWKGDPRMQPRDSVYWNRLDGTTEEITLETITLTHEGGGTSAEITYRKGVI